MINTYYQGKGKTKRDEKKLASLALPDRSMDPLVDRTSA
jgi:hypothetical protein